MHVQCMLADLMEPFRKHSVIGLVGLLANYSVYVSF